MARHYYTRDDDEDAAWLAIEQAEDLREYGPMFDPAEADEAALREYGR